MQINCVCMWRFLKDLYIHSSSQRKDQFREIAKWSYSSSRYTAQRASLFLDSNSNISGWAHVHVTTFIPFKNLHKNTARNFLKKQVSLFLFQYLRRSVTSYLKFIAESFNGPKYFVIYIVWMTSLSIPRSKFSFISESYISRVAYSTLKKLLERFPARARFILNKLK